MCYFMYYKCSKPFCILLKVDFEKLEIENPADTRRKEYIQKRKEKLSLEKLEAIRLEIKGTV